MVCCWLTSRAWVQGHARQAVSSAGTGPSSCSLAVLEDRLLALRGAEQQLYTRTCDVLWAPKVRYSLAQGLQGSAMVYWLLS